MSVASLLPQRIVSLWLPRLTTDRLARRERSRNGSAPSGEQPLRVAVGKQGNSLRLVAVDDSAAALGLGPGLPLADARAQYPMLDVVEADPAADREMLAAIADWCRRYTPVVALDPPDGVFLDVSGSAHLFGGERALAEDLLRRLRLQGFSARFGLGDTAGLAWALARYGKVPIAPPGERERVLRPLPAAALGLDPETLQALARLGLRVVGQILDTPRGPLARRFGLDLLNRIDAALGLRQTPLAPRLAAPPYTAERRLPEPIVLTDHVLGLTRILSRSLAERLEAHGEGGRLFALELFRVDGAMRRLEAAASRPIRDPSHVARLFAERMAALHDESDAGFGFDLVRLSALRVEPLAPEALRFDGAHRVEADLAALGDRIGARIGPQAVTRFVPLESHLPERAASSQPAVELGRIPPLWLAPPAVYAQGLLRPLRLFARPEPIEVTAAVPDGPPAQFRWRRVLHRILRLEGPERIAPEWWRSGEPGLTRDYYRVEDEAGRRCWLFREGLYPRETDETRWFIHGIFV